MRIAPRRQARRTGGKFLRRCPGQIAPLRYAQIVADDSCGGAMQDASGFGTVIHEWWLGTAILVRADGSENLVLVTEVSPGGFRLSAFHPRNEVNLAVFLTREAGHRPADEVPTLVGGQNRDTDLADRLPTSTASGIPFVPFEKAC